MKTLGKRITYAREQKDWSQKELASRIEVSQQTISKLEDGKVVQSKYLIELAHALGVSVAWLRYGHSEPLEGKSIEQELISPGMPIIHWQDVPGWKCGLQTGLEINEFISVGDSPGPNCYALRVKGDAMVNTVTGNPSFPPGVIIIVDPDRVIELGQYVVAIQEGSQGAMFKQYVEDGGIGWLKPLNPQYPMVQVVDGIEVCGVVTGIFQNLVNDAHQYV